MHMQSPIRRVLTEDWSAQSKSASAKSEGWSPKTKPSLRRVASEPGELGWKRSYGLVSIHTRPLLEHEVQRADLGTGLVKKNFCQNSERITRIA